MPAATTKAIAMPPVPPIMKPMPMKRAVIKAISIAVLIMFMQVTSHHPEMRPARAAVACKSGNFRTRLQCPAGRARPRSGRPLAGHGGNRWD